MLYVMTIMTEKQLMIIFRQAMREQLGHRIQSPQYVIPLQKQGCMCIKAYNYVTSC